MQLETRIKKLTTILNKYEVEDLNQKYKEAELNMVISNFTKYPEVRYSENMKKRMINEAKRKKISKSKMDYIQFLIDKNNHFDYKKYQTEIYSQVSQFFDDLEKKEFKDFHTKGIFLEHDFDPKIIYCQIYSNSNFSVSDTEVKRFKTNFDLSEVWGFLENHRFDSFVEALEIIDLEDEEYPQIFIELFKLHSYKLLKKSFQTKKIKDRIGLKNLKIVVGEHDNWSYEIYNE